MAIVGEAYVVVKAITTGFQNSVQNAVKSANLGSQGSQAGQIFGKGFSKGATKGLSGFAKEAEAARVTFARLVETGYAAGPAIAGLLSAVSALASGLFAMGAQAASAVPALIVLPSLFTAMAQAAITAKLALGGVFKAVGELGRARTPAVDQMPAKLRAFENAQWRLKKAQDAVNESYRKASERLEDLAFDSEDAAFAQQRAAMDLEDARKTLQRVQDLPPNSRARQEAELAFKEADLNYRRATDRVEDLAYETNKATQNGKLNADEQVNQSDEVLNAKREERDATLALAEAQKALKQAQSGGGQLVEFNKLSKEAQEFAKYLSGLAPEIQKLKDAAGRKMFAPLEEGIQNLVDNFFPRLIPLLEDTGEAFGNAMLDFSKIVTEENNLKNFEAVGRTNVDTIGKFGVVTGNLYSTFLSLLSAADPLIRRFTDWLVVLTDGWKATSEAKNQSGELTGMFDKAGDAAAQLGRIFGNLFTAIKDIGKAASGPGSGGQMLMDSFENATQKFEDFVKRISADGSLQQYFRDVVPTVESIGRFIVEIGRGFAKLGDNKETATAFDSLSRAVPAVFGALERFSEATPALAEFVRKLVELLSKFAESESINIYFGILGKALDIVNSIFSNEIVMRVVIFLGAIKAVMLAFTRISIVLGFFGRAIAGTIIKLVGLGNAQRGVMIIQKLWNIVMNNSFVQTKLLQAMYLKDAAMKKIAAAATKVWTGIQAAFNAVMAGNPIALVVLAIVALIAIIVIAYKKFEGFRNVVDAVFGFIKSVISGVWNGILAAFNFVWDAIQVAIEVGKVLITAAFIAIAIPFVLAWRLIKEAFDLVWPLIYNAITFAWNNIIKPVFEAIGSVFSFIWGQIKQAFEFYWGIISGAISFVWNNVIKPVFEAFGSVFSKVWGGIRSAFSTVWDFITGAIGKAKSVFEGVGEVIKNAFKAAFNFVAEIWNKTLGKISFKVPGWVPGIGGNEFSVPKIPLLAEGGVIPATRGGMLAVIGEAGRPERVEPLDPDGLSRRDKAIISMLSGGAAAGATINVYPSPGMNEVELAALVNRQLSFAMKKGAA
jgi:phage-related protein